MEEENQAWHAGIRKEVKPLYGQPPAPAGFPLPLIWRSLKRMPLPARKYLWLQGRLVVALMAAAADHGF